MHPLTPRLVVACLVTLILEVVYFGFMLRVVSPTNDEIVLSMAQWWMLLGWCPLVAGASAYALGLCTYLCVRGGEIERILGPCITAAALPGLVLAPAILARVWSVMPA